MIVKILRQPEYHVGLATQITFIFLREYLGESYKALFFKKSYVYFLKNRGEIPFSPLRELRCKRVLGK
jgi:hypothetical protein